MRLARISGPHQGTGAGVSGWRPTQPETGPHGGCGRALVCRNVPAEPRLAASCDRAPADRVAFAVCSRPLIYNRPGEAELWKFGSLGPPDPAEEWEMNQQNAALSCRARQGRRQGPADGSTREWGGGRV